MAGPPRPPECQLYGTFGHRPGPAMPNIVEWRTVLSWTTAAIWWVEAQFEFAEESREQHGRAEPRGEARSR